MSVRRGANGSQSSARRRRVRPGRRRRSAALPLRV